MGVSATSAPRTKAVVRRIYRKLFSSFGPQHWWPAQTPFEVMVGAILVQNTNWKNVEKAINNLKSRKLLSPHKLHALSLQELAQCIRPAGYFNVKAKRLKNFAAFFISRYGGSVARMRAQPLKILRVQLLSVNGIGEETADSILLYALKKPIFVVDAYTQRIFTRHRLRQRCQTYGAFQEVFMKNLPKSAKLFNEYHALLVHTGKTFCKKLSPRCTQCPLAKRSCF